MSTPSQRDPQLSADEAATLPPAPALAETETVPPALPAGPGTVSFAPAGAEPATLPPSGPMSTGSAQAVTVPGYEILGELGRGGMGVVYKVKQTGLNRIVALKMILVGGHATREDLQRFRTEAEAIARLQHPGIVQVFEVGEHDGLPFFSLEFCSGGSLKDKLAGTPLPPGEAATLVEKLARAMQAAHEKGVIHRDLKPANVLLAGAGRDSASGGREPPEASSGGSRPPLAEPKITDFGLARKLDEAGQTATGAVMGTPSYMAPEQAGMASSGRQPGESAVGPPCDIYALGAILYECLTGRPPFRAATPLDTILQVVSAEPVPPSQLNASLPRDLETICLKCLRKEPARRYASAADLAADLARFQCGEPIQARPVGRLERGAKWVRRNPVVAALVTTVAAVLLLGVGVAWGLAAWALGEAERAEGEKRNALDRAADLVREQSETRRQLALARTNLFTGQLLRVKAVYEKDPYQGYELLHDYNACPIDLRDFTWGWYARQCKRDRLTLLGHTSGVTSVAFSPDGKTLASGGGEFVKPGEKMKPGEIKLWDVATGQERANLKGHAGVVLSVAFSSDGKTLASGSGYTIKLWDVATGQERANLKGHTDWVSSVAFSSDGKTLASGSGAPDKPGEIKLWDVATGQERAALKGHTHAVSSVAFSSDGKTLASGSGDPFNPGKPGEIKLWDVATGQERANLKGHTGFVSSVAFSSDGKTLASGSGDRTIKLWDVATGQERAALKGHTGAVSSVALQERAALKRHTGFVSSVAFSSDGKTLASGSHDTTIKLWDFRADEIVAPKR